MFSVDWEVQALCGRLSPHNLATSPKAAASPSATAITHVVRVYVCDAAMRSVEILPASTIVHIIKAHDPAEESDGLVCCGHKRPLASGKQC